MKRMSVFTGAFCEATADSKGIRTIRFLKRFNRWYRSHPEEGDRLQPVPKPEQELIEARYLKAITAALSLVLLIVLVSFSSGQKLWSCGHDTLIEDTTNYWYDVSSTYDVLTTYDTESTYEEYVPYWTVESTEAPVSPDWPGIPVDEGTKNAPSHWYPANNSIFQDSNIWDGIDTRDAPAKLGSYLVAGSYSRISIKAVDDDAVGILFRYQDNDNYWRFSLDRQRMYRRVTQKQNGLWQLMAEDSGKYVPGVPFEVRMNYGIWINNLLVFPLADDPQIAGLYTWGSNSTQYFGFRSWSVDSAISINTILHIVQYVAETTVTRETTFLNPNIPTTWILYVDSTTEIPLFTRPYDFPYMELRGWPEGKYVAYWEAYCLENLLEPVFVSPHYPLNVFYRPDIYFDEPQ